MYGSVIRLCELVFRLRCPGLCPGQVQCVMSLGNTLYSHSAYLLLRYKFVLVNLIPGDNVREWCTYHMGLGGDQWSSNAL